MRAFWTGLGLASLAATVFLADLAPAQRHADDYRRSMGNLRPDHRTAVPAIQGSPPPFSRERSGHSHVYHPQYPVYDLGYHYYPYGWRYYAYPSWYEPSYWQYGYSAPLVIPNGALFGPVAPQRFFGVNRVVVPRPAVVIEDAGNERDAGAAAPLVNRDVLARAWRFIGYGDAHFRNGKYSEALSRYKSAATSSPTLADAYFRQGYALTAMGRYEPAARAIERGLGLDPNWARSGFRNDDLYGQNVATKEKHIDALAAAAADAPNDAALQFLFGVYLYFDGRPKQAAPFFEHAAQLIGDDTHVAGFRPHEDAKPAEPEKK